MTSAWCEQRMIFNGKGNKPAGVVKTTQKNLQILINIP